LYSADIENQHWYTFGAINKPFTDLAPAVTYQNTLNTSQPTVDVWTTQSNLEESHEERTSTHGIVPPQRLFSSDMSPPSSPRTNRNPIRPILDWTLGLLVARVEVEEKSIR
jgi:hypothetical protein